MGPGYPGVSRVTRADGTAPSGYVQLLEARLGAYGSVPQRFYAGVSARVSVTAM